MRVRMGVSGYLEEVPHSAWEVRESFLEVVMSEMKSRGKLARRREVVGKGVLSGSAECQEL